MDAEVIGRESWRIGFIDSWGKVEPRPSNSFNLSWSLFFLAAPSSLRAIGAFEDAIEEVVEWIRFCCSGYDSVRVLSVSLMHKFSREISEASSATDSRTAECVVMTEEHRKGLSWA